MNETTIATENFLSAIDQVDSYDSERSAFEAYHTNVFDAASEAGLDISLATDIFDGLVKNHSVEVFNAMWTF